MKTELPQFAAQAVIDLRLGAYRSERYSGPDADKLGFMPFLMRSAAAIIQNGEHVLLPANGEAYRPNCDAVGNSIMPTPDEAKSLAYLPWPVTCFEYTWNHHSQIAPDSELSSRRITIAIDSRKISGEGHILLMSVFFHDELKMWMLMDADLALKTATTFYNLPGNRWGAEVSIRNLATLKSLEPGDPVVGRITGEFAADINAVIQFCHSIKTGSTLQKHRGSHFIYQTLKNPEKSA